MRINGFSSAHSYRSGRGTSLKFPHGVVGGVLVALLAGCTTTEISNHFDTLKRSVDGADVAGTTSPTSSATSSTSKSTPPRRTAVLGAVSFARRMPFGPDIVRPAIEDGAMQLRVGHDFAPSPTVDNAMPYHWSASCDAFYLVASRLQAWHPPADRLSRLSLEDACALDEAGLALRHSALDDPIRRRPAPVLNTSFGVSDAIAQWRPVVSKRMAEIAGFGGDRYFFVGVKRLDIRSYDRVKQGFFISVDLDTGYGWDKPIVFVGPQLSNQQFNVQLRTDEQLARLIDESRSSNARIPTQRVLVVFRLNDVKDMGNRIEINITLEKVELSVFKTLTTPPVLVNTV